MGQSGDKTTKIGSEVDRLDVRKTLNSIMLNLFFFIIVIVLFALSISWLFDNINQVNLLKHTYYYAAEPPAAHKENLAEIKMYLFSASSWLLGVIAVKITDAFLNHCWGLLKFYAKRARGFIKKKRRN